MKTKEIDTPRILFYYFITYPESVTLHITNFNVTDGMETEQIQRELEELTQRVELQEWEILYKKDLLTFEEAGKLLGIPLSTLYRMTSEKSIPHYKLNGKRIYFMNDELRRWIKSKGATARNYEGGEAEDEDFMQRFGQIWKIKEREGLTALEVYTYLFLLGYARFELQGGDIIKCSIIKLSSLMCVSRNMLKKAIHHLEELSLVEYIPSKTKTPSVIRLKPTTPLK